MGIGDYICDIVMGIIYVEIVHFVCGLRGGKVWHVFLNIISILAMIGCDYFYRINMTMSNWVILLSVLILEIFNMMFTAYWGKGDFWKNLFILVCGTQMVSSVTAMAKEFDKTAEYVFYEIMSTRIPTELAEGVLFSIMEIIGGLLAIIVMTFLFKDKREHKIYKYLSLGFLLIAAASGFYRIWYNFGGFHDETSIKVFSAVFTATSMVPLFIAFNLIGLSHIKSEKKRIEQEIKLLDKTIQDRCTQYENLAKTDQALIKYKEEYEKNLRDKDSSEYAKALLENSESIKMQAWTGKLLVDTVLFSANQKLGKQGICFEYTIEDIMDERMSEEDFAYLFEQLLELGRLLGTSSQENPYIVLTERKRNENCVVKIDFSKENDVKLRYERKSIVIKQHQVGNKKIINRITLKKIEEIVQELNLFAQKYDTSLIVTDEGTMGMVSFIVC